MRSRCFGSMFAWILKTKPVTLSSSGRTLRSAAGWRLRRRRQVGRAPSSSSRTPKLLSARAEEHRRHVAGEVTSCGRTAVHAPRDHLDVLAQLFGSVVGQQLVELRIVEALACFGAVVAAFSPCVPRTSGPADRRAGRSSPGSRLPMPIGHADRRDVERQRRARSRPAASNGSRPSRSSLLMNVRIGMSRRRQTSNSLRVCASMPLARVDHHHAPRRPRSACGRCLRRSPGGRACRAG